MMMNEREELNILLVENSSRDAKLIEKYLAEALETSHIYHEKTFKNVIQPLKDGTVFSVILFDLSLPDLSGETLVRKMLEIAGSIPLVVLSDYENKELGLKTLSMGVADCLLKDELSPFTLQKVMNYTIERNRMLKNAKESEKKYRDYFNLNPQPMWVYDRKKQQFSDINKAALAQNGYSKNDFFSMTLQEILHNPKLNSEMDEQLYEAIEHRGSAEITIFKYDSQEYPYWLDVTINPVFDSEGNCTHFIGIQQDVTERRKKIRDLQDSLIEKETLLMEIHHRIKNNLAVVSSMVQLQAMEEENVFLREKMFDIVSRIRTIVNIHEHLYESKNFSSLDFTANLKKLISMVVKTFNSKQHVNIDFKCSSVQLDVHQATIISLIINEIVTNAIKHAHTGDSDEMVITVLLQEVENRVEIMVSDNGKGLPKDFDKENGSSLGVQLIRDLAQQMNANYDYYASSEGGTVFKIQFEKRTREKPGVRV